MNLSTIKLSSQRFLIAAVMGAVGAAAAVTLPQPSRAMDFAFYYNESNLYKVALFDPSLPPYYEVEGFIQALEPQGVNQVPKSVSVYSSSWDGLSVGTYHFMEGEGFDVVDGEITKVNWIGMLDSPDTYRKLVFSTSVWSMWANIETEPPFSPPLPPAICACTQLADGAPGSVPVFVPLETTPYIRTTSLPVDTTGVPGPVPFLGAAAAFQCSRKLRRRLQEASRVPTATSS